jgi:chromosome segregation ATPase
VTPSSSYNAPSWEDFDEGVFAASHKARRNINATSSFTSSNSNSTATSTTANTSYVQDDDDEDMPMDEMMSLKKPRAPLQNTTPASAAAPAVTITETATAKSQQQVKLGVASSRSIEIVNSDEDRSQQESGLSRIIVALKQVSSSSPTNLTPEERVLWDSIQKSMSKSEANSKQKQESIQEAELEMKLSEAQTKLAHVQQKLRHSSSDKSQDRNTTKRVNDLQEQLRQYETALKTKEAEHDAEVRAIQRVLAEMHTERESETQELTEKVKSLTATVQALQAGNPGGAPVQSVASVTSDSSDMDEEIANLKTALKDSEAKHANAKRDYDKKSRRLMTTERDFKVAKVQLKKANDAKNLPKELETTQTNELESMKQEVTDLKQLNEKLQSELDINNATQKTKRNTPRALAPPRPESAGTDSESVSSALSAEEVEGLQKSFSDTCSSLENAKKIIASLENANGSLALDLRAKLKVKEEELTVVQQESADRKRHLDSLATELRDLQKKQGDVDHLEKRNKAQLMRHKALMVQLEKSVSGLRSASVVHEVSSATGQPDSANVDEISEILSDTMFAIKTTLEMAERYVEEFDDASDIAFGDVDVSSEVGRHLDSLIRNDREAASKDLRQELDQKKTAVRRLEDALKKQNEEMKRLRSELQGRNRGQDSTDQQLRAEIQSLRAQCSTNMELLAKKERELSVLRSSLNVDENDAGYISDDASDADEDDTNTVVTARLNGYGPAETEALATILSAGGTMPVAGDFRESGLKNELLKAIVEKEKAAKDLQAERESLANAKMIISSLEKANKSMMEDLRSRLQDSNTAIASLLDKSMEHETSANTMREEVEKFKKEKEELEDNHQSHVKKLKDEAKVYSLRIAAKDRELNDLRKGTDAKSASEEKKEDIEEETEVGPS